MKDISTKLWAQYTQSILGAMGAAGSDGKFQVLTTGVRLPSAGTSPKALTHDLSFFLNTIPQWGSNYAASTVNAVQAYQIVLGQIEAAPDANTALKTQFNNAIGFAETAAAKSNAYLYNTDATRGPLGLFMQYQHVKQELTDAGVPDEAIPQYEQWYAPYVTTAKALNDQAVTLGMLADNIVKAEASGPWIQARDNLNNWMKGNPGKPAPFNFVTDPWLTLNGWIQGKGKEQKSVNISQGSREYDYSKSEWTTHSSHSSFFGLVSSGSTEHHSRESVLDESSHYNLTIAYDAQALLLAAPSSLWFNGSVLREYKTGPWREGTQFENGNSHPYPDGKGKGGVFPLMVTGMYVVFNPTITIELDEHTYTKLKTTVSRSGGGGFSFGPFYKNPHSASSSDTKTKEHWDDARNTVTITDSSGVPQIIAVSDQVMPGEG